MIKAKTVKDQLAAANRVVRWFDAQAAQDETLLKNWRLFNKLSHTTYQLELEYKLEEQASKSL